MNTNLIKENKVKLMTEKKRLEELLSELGPLTDTKSREDYKSDFPNMGDSQDDNAQEVTQYETNLGKEKVLETRLQKVNIALEKIENGTYGKCLVGGEDIEEARLKVAPEVDTCVKHSG
ncbi:MAG: hypothetical protein COT91_04390 [Candidatus Doudnabacteria bacterium CG10_big_fil_rev_8_21_14_0_10_41_10]|uniref:Uncharacterized protein n=1 Tax=Candidatus Doudnabacteria bacterium CG10_big_fil_rev_8_21_14_0_10_41_10 TaxID=1974551 RepID=A0A2H0VCP7_9BACT|nr:MAG: hypothetical protein COT91_04390 [Candidatus Doudnabacteria bacterium CG10_big_fil_rev_8_21_14_0_10_41_10]